MRIIVTVFAVALGGTAPGQISFTGVDGEFYPQGSSPPITVELTGCAAFDAKLRTVIHDHWTQGEASFAELRSADKSPGLWLRFGEILIQQLGPNGESGSSVYGWMLVAPATKGPRKELSNIVAFAGASCRDGNACGDGKNPWSCAQYLPVKVAQLNDVLGFLRSTGYVDGGKEGFAAAARFGEHFARSRSASSIRAKPLLINAGKFYDNVLAPADVRKYYPYPVEIVDEVTFTEKLEQLDPGYTYLIIENAPNLVLSVLDPVTMQTLYLDAEALRASTTYLKLEHKFISRKSLERLVKAINK